MNIFQEIKSSVYDPEYYRSVINDRSFSSSLKYLAKLTLLVALAFTLIFAANMPRFAKLVKRTVSEGVANYQNDLVITFKNGNASVNKPEPYIMKFPQSWIDAQKSGEDKIMNLLVIDTKDPFDSKTFLSYSTVALITKTDLITLKDNKGTIQVTPISKIGDVEVTKSLLQEKEAKFRSLLPIIYIVLPIMVYIFASIGIFLGTMFMLLIYAVAALIVAKLKKKDLSYKKAYQVGMHAISLLVILGLLTTFAGFPNYLLMKLVIFGLIVYANLADSPKVETLA